MEDSFMKSSSRIHKLTYYYLSFLLVPILSLILELSAIAQEVSNKFNTNFKNSVFIDAGVGYFFPLNKNYNTGGIQPSLNLGYSLNKNLALGISSNFVKIKNDSVMMYGEKTSSLANWPILIFVDGNFPINDHLFIDGGLGSGVSFSKLTSEGWMMDPHQGQVPFSTIEKQIPFIAKVNLSAGWRFSQEIALKISTGYTNYFGKTEFQNNGMEIMARLVYSIALNENKVPSDEIMSSSMNITSVVPNILLVPDNLFLTVNGWGFNDNIQASITPNNGISINKIDVINSNQLLIYLSIDCNAISGDYQLFVNNPNLSGISASFPLSINLFSKLVEIDNTLKNQIQSKLESKRVKQEILTRFLDLRRTELDLFEEIDGIRTEVELGPDHVPQDAAMDFFERIIHLVEQKEKIQQEVEDVYIKFLLDQLIKSESAIGTWLFDETGLAKIPAPCPQENPQIRAHVFPKWVPSNKDEGCSNQCYCDEIEITKLSLNSYIQPATKESTKLPKSIISWQIKGKGAPPKTNITGKVSVNSVGEKELSFGSGNNNSNQDGTFEIEGEYSASGVGFVFPLLWESYYVILNWTQECKIHHKPLTCQRSYEIPVAEVEINQ